MWLGLQVRKAMKHSNWLGSGITARKASNKDFNKLLNLFTIINEDFVPPVSKRGTLKENVENIMKIKNCYTLILENQMKETMGIISFKKDKEDGKAAYIPWIAVHPKFRRMGVGSMLLSEALKLMKKDHISSVTTRTWSTNAASLKLWRNAEFKKSKVIKDDRGSGIDTIYLTREL